MGDAKYIVPVDLLVLCKISGLFFFLVDKISSQLNDVWDSAHIIHLHPATFINPMVPCRIYKAIEWWLAEWLIVLYIISATTLIITISLLCYFAIKFIVHI